MELPGRRPRGKPKRKCVDVERGREVSWCEREGGRGQAEMEADDSLWRPLKGTAERKRRTQDPKTKRFQKALHSDSNH